MGQAGCRMMELVGERAAAGGCFQLSLKAEEDKPATFVLLIEQQDHRGQRHRHNSLQAPLPLLRWADQGEGSLQKSHNRRANH